MNPDLAYVAVEKDDEYLIVAKENLDCLREKLEITGDVAAEISGSDLEGLRAKHPFIDRESKIILGDFVTVGEGSGIVHIAPGHGEDDYEVGLKYGLEIYAPVDDHGKFTRLVPEFEGQFVFKANEGIIELAEREGCSSQGRKNQTLLSSLLALQEAGYLQGHRPVVHFHGKGRLQREGTQRDRKSCMGAVVGPGEDSRHGFRKAGLVYLPPEVMGRPDNADLLHRLRRIH